jgi:hypothetical protein
MITAPAWSAPHTNVLAQSALLASLGEDCVRTIGQTYRNRYPDENSAEILVGMIGAANTLDARIRREFASEDTVLLDGWVLSRTEARQGALFSILYS